MKKHLFTTALVALVSTQVWAAPETVLEKTESLEQAIYGQAQIGALVDRVNQLDRTVYGMEKSGSINVKVDSLYAAVEGNGKTASLNQDVNALEWMYQNEVTSGSILERINRLERSVTGRENTGSLQKRIGMLKQSIYGKDVKITPKMGSLESTHVFKLELLEPVSTKKNLLNDTVKFKVAEDVLDGDTLLIPRGAFGTGHITKLKKAASFGRSGHLDMVFDAVPTMDGSTFRAVQGEEAKEKTKSELKAAGASVAGAAILGPIGLVGGFFVKGKSVELPAGTIVYVQPESTVTMQGVQVTGMPHLSNAKVYRTDDATYEENSTSEESAINAADMTSSAPPMGNDEATSKEVQPSMSGDNTSVESGSKPVNVENTGAQSLPIETDEEMANVDMNKPVVVIKRSE